MSTMANTTKPRRPQRRFTEEFRAGAVRLALDEGQTAGRVALELDLTESALRTWVDRTRADRTKGRTGLTTEEREELRHLRKEVRTLRIEREILKQAAVSSRGRCNAEMITPRSGHRMRPSSTYVGSRQGGDLETVEAWRIAERHRPCASCKRRESAGGYASGLNRRR